MDAAIPIIAALVGGGLVQLIISFSNRKKTDAESTNLLTEAADRIVGRLENEIASLRNEVTAMHVEVTALRLEVKRLGGDPDHVRATMHTIANDLKMN